VRILPPISGKNQQNKTWKGQTTSQNASDDSLERPIIAAPWCSIIFGFCSTIYETWKFRGHLPQAKKKAIRKRSLEVFAAHQACALALQA